uniref:NADH-ubiquinone oxidoreductase chain 1 n=1 Tax=Gnathostoma doloresi TaxID=279402 RepID=A0A1J0KIL1_9BILA|nr:NADH dehydrogenase subunit 1 [Gnathostoma doloresi]APC93882.1 NADH dehydrogenase subunit 1 [Gnathostoma doloresi]APD14826.1 NADH dehydrogenase subunit 1 [Gnathostoma doloresi]
MLLMLVLLLLIMIFIVQAIAFITLYERHLLGSSQGRIGPNKVSFMGVLQAIFDGVKLLKKEQLTTLNSSELSFLLVPGIAFMTMYLEWFTLPYFYEFFTFQYSVLFFLCLLGFTVYAILISGIVSKSKYGMVGALRASNQSISYEIAFSLYLLMAVMYFNSVSFVENWNLGLMVIFVPVFLMILAELNRAPFDFAEGESELVSGFNVEYSSVAFVLLFLSEYGSLLFFSVLFSVVFLNFSFIGCFLLFSMVIFIRSAFPRFRYDKMMEMFWFKLLPLSLVLLSYVVIILV